MSKVRVAVIGVGNCASSFVQGVHYYKDAEPAGFVPGLMHVNLGGYHISDIEFSAAIDIDKNKVGKDLAEAIYTKPNNTYKFCDVPKTGITVQRGMTHDGLGFRRVTHDTASVGDRPPAYAYQDPYPLNEQLPYMRSFLFATLVDAAKVDGCSDLAMFWYIGLPLARSVVAMLLFTQFSLLWNGFFAASIFLERDLYKTLPVGIAVMAQQTGALNPNPTAYGKVLLLRPDMALVAIFTVLPVIIIYLLSQRLIVRAATAGAIHGE